MDISNFSTDALLKELAYRVNCDQKKQTRAILVGPPGCGKGTQSPFIKKEYCVCHLATGDMLRAAVAAGSELGKRAKAKMNAGQMVDDEIVVGLVRESINQPKCRNGFVLDGFPRTMPQAKMLDDMLKKEGAKLDSVIEFKIDDEVVKERISGRWIHKASGRSYHTKFNPPKVAGIDDVTGEPLMQRRDDNINVIGARLQAFRRETNPVLDFYRTRGLVSTINAVQSISAVRRDLTAALGDAYKK